MLRNEITALIPQATEICNLPLSLYNENHGYDIVISTVILPNEKKLVVVHPILTDQDRVTILRNCMYTDPHAKMQIDEITKIASSYMNPTNLIKFQKSLQEYYSSIQIPKVPHRKFWSDFILLSVCQTYSGLFQRSRLGRSLTYFL